MLYRNITIPNKQVGTMRPIMTLLQLKIHLFGFGFTINDLIIVTRKTNQLISEMKRRITILGFMDIITNDYNYFLDYC